ncbi:MAG: fluoride efflux transporter CrcB [Ruminococcus sp.]|nr:fluoride efflux transporter CrcB [Ruminococcus sp.]
MKFIYVALGGAIGAAARYSLSLIPVKPGFIITMITNILGAVLIGFIAGIASEKDISPDLVLFLKTGVCGGFTTFSTFSLEALTLLENKQYAEGSAYIALSCALCIIGVLCGRRLAAQLL